jgi:autotransporter-associated beta strand protein
MDNSRRNRISLVASYVLIALFCPSIARADLSLWVPASGDWDVPGNWSGGFVPGSTDPAPIQAVIMNQGEATIDSAVPNVDEVWVGNGTEKGTLNVVTGGALNVTNTAQSGILVVGRTFSVLGEHSGSRLNVSGGTIVADGIEAGQVFSTDASTDAQITISGTGQVTVRNFMRIGHGESNITFGAEGIMTVKDNGKFVNNGTGTLPFINDFIAFGFNGGGGVTGGNHGTLNLEDNAIFESKRPVRFGWVEEGHGTLNISDNAQLIIDSGELSAAAIMFGDFNNSAVGTGDRRPFGVANQTGGTVTVGTDVARPRWTAIGGSGYGEYNLSGGKLNIYVRDGLNIGDTDQNGFAGEGKFNMSGGTVNATEMTLGKIGRAAGTFTQTGGDVYVGVVSPDGNFVDRIDTIGEQVALDPNLDGALTLGTGFGAASTSSGTYTMSNGTLHARRLNVGFFANGTFTQSGGTATVDTGVIVAFGTNDAAVPSTGIMSLNGGVFETAAIGGGGGGNSTVNFNGGTVRATVAQPDFLVNLTTANVQAGGLIVDSNGFDVGSNQAFTGAGGLTKKSAGRLAMSGNSTYGGTTKVEAGALLVNGTHAGGAAYTVDSGATLGGIGNIGSAVTVNGALAPGDGVGTLTVNNNVSFGTSGIFDVQIDAAGNVADRLNVMGNLNLSGLSDMLRLSLAGGALPLAGPLTIASYTGSLTGTFNLDNANFTINYGDGSNDIITISNITSIDSAILIGDYNNSGTVDAADYTIWRNNVGNPGTTLQNRDPGNGGVVGPDDYDSWKSNFGAGGGGSLGVTNVPEPSAMILVLLGSVGLAFRRR